MPEREESLYNANRFNLKAIFSLAILIIPPLTHILTSKLKISIYASKSLSK